MIKSKIIFQNIKNHLFYESRTFTRKIQFYVSSFHNTSIRYFTPKSINDNVIEELKKRGLVNALTRL